MMSIPHILRSFRLFEPWTWFASLGFLAFLKQFIPYEYTDGVQRNVRSWLHSVTPYIYCDVHEYENSSVNTLYVDVEIYLSSLTVKEAHRLNISQPKNAKTMTFGMAHDQRTEDQFEGAKIQWVHRVYERPRMLWTNNFESSTDEKRTFTLQIGRRDKNNLEKYLAHIQGCARDLKRAARDLLLYTNSKSRESYFGRSTPWTSVNFAHPATFDTLALDGDLKSKICQDLERFAQGEAYYKRVGKAWKRGYLLYGPPGTGKSSMIAAIANKMRYDVYDLELTEVESNIELRKLLLHTNNKSVIVIEDIDCSLDLSGQRKKKKKKPTNPENPGNPGDPMRPTKEQSKVTLSGLLNFVDGLWSCCGTERIFIFTTNYVEKLDPALLRAGRMDMHIHLSYCTFSAFLVLAQNYLQISDHELFHELRSSFEGSYMTPAEVSEVLIRDQDSATVALEKLRSALDEHRTKPPPPPPDSDDEDEKDAADSAPTKEGELTTKSDDAASEEPSVSLDSEKEISIEKTVHPAEDDLEIKEEQSASNSSNSVGNGNCESRSENGVRGTFDDEENEDTKLQRYAENDLLQLSRLGGKEDIMVEDKNVSTGQTRNGLDLKDSGRDEEVAGDGTSVPHSSGSTCKENYAVANEGDHRLAKGGMEAGKTDVTESN
ncbi:hypothetical protein R1flu_025359 [Riccia fluitans]|uniref:AAA+ ATPase domain-containing protein n=1 Tax=Riccia fluitans TaxID=41844 RepID=A0ABD1XXJ2_9MARC